MTSASSSDQTNKSGGCPIKHSPPSSSTSSTMSSSSPWGSWFRTKQQPNEQKKQTPPPCGSSESIGSCPVQHQNRNNGESNAMPMPMPVQPPSANSIEEAAKHAQTPQPDQTIPLSTHRTISSIPKSEAESTAATGSPHHQPEDKSNWVYPSEQQFYNAMKRKGWDIAPGTESTIPFVVQIHNAVNEKGWKDIREWEKLRNNNDPKLVKFIGRPKDLSPRAMFYSSLYLRKEPFDRHDWFVSREDGSDLRRYVIDFYNGKEEQTQQPQQDVQNVNLPRMYLDVRPALDDSDAAGDRMKMFFKDAFPGIASFIF